MRRRMRAEFMDEPGAPEEALRRALRFIRFANRRLGGVSALTRRLEGWSRAWPRAAQGPVRLLDVGTGSADLPIAAVRWARRRGFDLRVTGLDLHPTTLRLAAEYVRTRGGDVRDAIDLVEGDALRLTDRFAPGSFDHAHAGLFLHHLGEIEAMTVLRQMQRVARGGLLWNDLRRGRLAWLAIHALTVGQARDVRFDAIVSVEKGFTRREALDMARRVGLEDVRYRLDVRSQRFSLWTGGG